MSFLWRCCFSDDHKGRAVVVPMKIRDKPQSEEPTASPLAFTREQLTRWERNMNNVLMSQKGLKLFMAFCESCHCDENLLAWIAIKEFKLLRDETERKDAARRIFFDYFAEANDSFNDFENVVHKKLCSISHAVLEQLKYDLEHNVITPTMFDRAQRQVFKNLSDDPFPRFLDFLKSKLNEASHSSPSVSPSAAHSSE